MATVTQTACSTTSEAGFTYVDRGFGITVQTGHDLIGTTLSTIKFPMKKSTSSAVSGILSVRIYNSSGVLQETSSSTVDASTFSTSFVDYEWTLSGSHTIASGDFIGVCLDSGSPDGYVVIQFSDTTCYDYTNSAAINPPTITQYTSWDGIFEATTGSASSGTVLLPPPPLVVHF